jgi:8-oxo-dGTP pyrophosphatase MutT (NUDIX family)
MTIRESLIRALTDYKTSFVEEGAFRDQFLELLAHPRCFYRDHLPGHITGSAWIIDETGMFVLLTHHAKLNKWLQPGGHADGDEDVARVALREAIEETGLQTIQIKAKTIFDLDIHAIPARNNFPEHLHYDIRFLIQASRLEPVVLTEESHALEWIPVGALAERTGNNLSMMRMASKVSQLF